MSAYKRASDQAANKYANQRIGPLLSQLLSLLLSLLLSNSHTVSDKQFQLAQREARTWPRFCQQECMKNVCKMFAKCLRNVPKNVCIMCAKAFVDQLKPIVNNCTQTRAIGIYLVWWSRYKKICNMHKLNLDHQRRPDCAVTEQLIIWLDADKLSGVIN